MIYKSPLEPSLPSLSCHQSRHCQHVPLRITEFCGPLINLSLSFHSFRMRVLIAVILCIPYHCVLGMLGADKLSIHFAGLLTDKNYPQAPYATEHNLDFEPEPETIMG